MTDLLDRLVARVRGSEDFVQPRIASLYEPVQRPDLEEIWAEEVVGPRQSASQRSVRPGPPVTERPTGPRDGGIDETATRTTPGPRDGGIGETATRTTLGVANVAASSPAVGSASGEAPAPPVISPSSDSSADTGWRGDDVDTPTGARRPPLRQPRAIRPAPSIPPASPLAPPVAIAAHGESPGDDRDPDPAGRIVVSPTPVVPPPAGPVTIPAQRRIAHTRPPGSLARARPAPLRQLALETEVDQIEPEVPPASAPRAVVATPRRDALPQATAVPVPAAPQRPVRITIGRIEVRANPPRPPEPQGDRDGGSSSLDAYLDRWSRGA